MRQAGGQVSPTRASLLVSSASTVRPSASACNHPCATEYQSSTLANPESIVLNVRSKVLQQQQVCQEQERQCAELWLNPRVALQVKHLFLGSPSTASEIGSVAT